MFTALTIIVSIYYSFLSAASISAITRVMIYGIVCFSLIKLRKKNAAQTDHFRIPYGKFFAIAGIAIAIWLLSSSKLTELRDVAIALGAGLVIYILVEWQKKKKTPVQI